ncbi:hypothetical protein BCR44DRAFT_1536340 [Catenaria anguillulae PL171]|uniref:Uncharacterized protein n=1 Tax=Catenaria anguillulae PL171 TaxID=765915 RepID=A0A1Y2HZN9_9FUNG|nr:hypothetical protein BCR44DRAFT_1536340 [Catenaria anguillulae PL171]
MAATTLGVETPDTASYLGQNPFSEPAPNAEGSSARRKKRKASKKSKKQPALKKRKTIGSNAKQAATPAVTSNGQILANPKKKQLSILNFTERIKLIDHIKTVTATSNRPSKTSTEDGQPETMSTADAAGDLAETLKRREAWRIRKARERAGKKQEEMKSGKRDKNGKLVKSKKPRRLHRP